MRQKDRPVIITVRTRTALCMVRPAFLHRQDDEAQQRSIIVQLISSQNCDTSHTDAHNSAEAMLMRTTSARWTSTLAPSES